MYVASNNEHTIVGSISEISIKLNVSRQAVNQAKEKGLTCKGYSISFAYKKQRIKKTKIERYRDAINLLKRCRLIIDEENIAASNRGEYSNIGILEDIDNFLGDLNESIHN